MGSNKSPLNDKDLNVDRMTQIETNSQNGSNVTNNLNTQVKISYFFKEPTKKKTSPLLAKNMARKPSFYRNIVIDNWYVSP